MKENQIDAEYTFTVEVKSLGYTVRCWVTSDDINSTSVSLHVRDAVGVLTQLVKDGKLFNLRSDQSLQLIASAVLELPSFSAVEVIATDAVRNFPSHGQMATIGRQGIVLYKNWNLG